jgi:hypothetical protein
MQFLLVCLGACMPDMLLKIVTCNSPASPNTESGELARLTPSANRCFAYTQIPGNIFHSQNIW